MKVGRLLQR